MKRLLLLGAGLLLASTAGCCYRPACVDPCTGIPYGGYWEPLPCPLNPLTLFCPQPCCGATGCVATGCVGSAPACDPCGSCDPSYHVPGPVHSPGVVPNSVLPVPYGSPPAQPGYYSPNPGPAMPSQGPPPAPPAIDPPPNGNPATHYRGPNLNSQNPAAYRGAANPQWVPAY